MGNSNSEGKSLLLQCGAGLDSGFGLLFRDFDCLSLGA